MAVSLHQMVAAWRLWQEIDRQTFLVSIAYSAIGTAITMVARTKYGWDSGGCLALFPLYFVALAISFKNSTKKGIVVQEEPIKLNAMKNFKP